MITPEKIKETAARPLGNHELKLGELQALLAASGKSLFELACYAYSYGFSRGQEVAHGQT